MTNTVPTDFGLCDTSIIKMLDELAANDMHIKEAVKQVGYPAARYSPAGFAPLMRIIVGQQLSVKAAASIAARVDTLVVKPNDPHAFARQSDEDLRGCGLSFQKIKYGRALCEAVLDGSLRPNHMPDMSDEEILSSITAIKGFGRWSAEMYMMFSLGRVNIWPSGDLAVRAGIGTIIGNSERPNEKETDVIGERWHPYRSAVALLSWHYYSNPPL